MSRRQFAPMAMLLALWATACAHGGAAADAHGGLSRQNTSTCSPETGAAGGCAHDDDDTSFLQFAARRDRAGKRQIVKRPSFCAPPSKLVDGNLCCESGCACDGTCSAEDQERGCCLQDIRDSVRLCTTLLHTNCVLHTDEHVDMGMELVMLWYPEEESNIRKHKGELMERLMHGGDPQPASRILEETRVDPRNNAAAHHNGVSLLASGVGRNLTGPDTRWERPVSLRQIAESGFATSQVGACLLNIVEIFFNFCGIVFNAMGLVGKLEPLKAKEATETWVRELKKYKSRYLPLARWVRFIESIGVAWEAGQRGKAVAVVINFMAEFTAAVGLRTVLNNYFADFQWYDWVLQSVSIGAQWAAWLLPEGAGAALKAAQLVGLLLSALGEYTSIRGAISSCFNSKGEVIEGQSTAFSQEVVKSQQHVGSLTRGSSFDDLDVLDGKRPVRSAPSGLTVWHDKGIWGLDISWPGKKDKAQHGKHRGTSTKFSEREIQEIGRVVLWANDKAVFGIRFDRFDGSTIKGMMGGDRGDRRWINVPADSYLAGFYGADGRAGINGLGLRTRRRGCEAVGDCAKLEFTCTLGVRDPESNTCCAATCGTCGGSARLCNRRPGGEDFCCRANIRRQQRVCKDNADVACLLPR